MNIVKKLEKQEDKNTSLRFQNKAYRIYIYGKKYKFLTESCKIPFGVEKYGGKEIVNLEFDTNINEQHNYCAIIRDIDKMFANIKNDESKMNVPNGFKSEIEKFFYTQSLREREYGKIHHR